MEALACQEVFARAARSEITLAWSFMHEDETILCPFPARRQEAFRLATLCQVRVAPAAAIRTLAQSCQAQSGLSAKDALHLACAAQVGAVCFVTCDDGLIRQAKRLRLALAILNPVDYVRQVEKMMDVAAMTVNDTELRIKGIEALNRDLGPVLALRFLSLLHREPTDYVDVARRLYAGQSIDEIFDRAEKQWRG